ncbi:hypothetical protein KUTeg_014969 [Tegillarca granosa]|uniref:Uncharacterized protein n=1 Tax=Tegillarca granosa TaxID=220873 RepID=A0ABQ9EU01_TEGGR|nr:hypothetical protein KUTeg_014969 [Tegillarca granosa]
MDDFEIDFPVNVVLPAGGCGERMSINQPKQYCEVLNRPLIVFTLYTFNRIPWIQKIVVTVSKNYVDYVKGLTQKYGYEKVTVVEGGAARHRSIYCGLKALENVCNQSDIVVIHDAVRIFAEEHLIKEIVMAAKLNGAAGVSRPLVSTVIAVDSEDYIEESLDRNKYRASEMPQAFRYDVIKTAYDKATDYDFDYGTECLLLAYKYTNTKAKIIVGPSNLWKVTYLKDLYAAEGMLKESLIKVQLIGCNLEMKEKLKTHISKHRLQQ